MASGFVWYLGVVATLCWLGLLAARLRAVLTVTLLSRLRADPPARWPSVTLVVSACNEEASVGSAVESLLSQSYPRFDVVAVNDRSTDRTGEILDALSARSQRLTVLHRTSLEEGWLGKVAAIQAGLARATGEFVLFVDADVHLAPGALERLMALVEHHALDHLTLLPRFVTTGLMQGALMAAFLEGYCQRARGWRELVLADHLPAFGYGAFNLVRRSTLEKTEGLAWLKMEVLDDLALGELLRRAAARRAFLVADEGVSLTWYPTFRDALRQFEKNFFASVARYSFARAAAFGAAMPVLFLGPLGLLAGGPVASWPFLLLLLGLHLIGTAAEWRRLGIRPAHGLLGPLAQLGGVVPMVAGALRAFREGAIVWRGTRYPLSALRAGRRVSFP
jgi:glycosyltransferase involved in cell wall biosynthesis